MAPLPLLGGAYYARSFIANAQRCVNLIPERNPEDSQPASPVTHYPRPGLRLLRVTPAFGLGRGLYRASNGALYKVIGPNVYYVDPNWNDTLLGTIALGTSITSMSDNGTDVLLVDGTTAGYSINLVSNVMSSIIDPAFYGANRVDYAGTAFILNRPGTPQFYISGPNALTWDPLDFGQKTASPDNLVAVAALNNQIWLLGTLRGEVWYFTGAADFPFQLLPGVLIEHGLAALYSIAVTDKFMFWLTQDKDGKPWIAQGGTDYSVKRVSTYAIDNEIQNYAVWSDAIGYVFQQQGHIIYMLNFPSADKTWGYDLSTKQWFEAVSIDVNGVWHRWRPQLQAFAYNTNVVLDWQNGNLYEMTPEVFKDGEVDFPCVRSFPHARDQMQRISYKSFIADMECGSVESVTETPTVFLRQSINRGKSYRTARPKSFGTVGEYKLIPKWWRLDQARDSVFEISWTANAKTALNGAFIELESAET